MIIGADQLGRSLRDLRLSVTDRCNFRCTYCMPKEVFGRDFAFLPKSEILTFEELTRLVRIFAGIGVRKVRLTGGEPLLRRDVEELISMLATVPGIEDLTLTTNGSLLAEKAAALRKAGLHRITVSLDSLDETVFAAMNGNACPVSKVLAGIEAARAAGFSPIKINAVVKRGTNDQLLLPIVERFRTPDYIVRFIEYMDVGNTNGWRLEEVVPATEIVRQIADRFPVEPVPASQAGEVASRWRYLDGKGEFGVISSVSKPFCGDCTRARLSSDGKIFTCLFSADGFDLRGPLRRGVPDEELAELIAGIWHARSDRYSELRSTNSGGSGGTKVEMSRIGG